MTTEAAWRGALVVGVFLGAACSPGGDDGTGSTTSWTGRPSAPVEPAAGRIVLRQEQLPGPEYEEGKVSHGRVIDAAGVTVASNEFESRQGAGGVELVLDVVVPAGEYTVESFQRGCAGDCAFLDPVSAYCEGSVTVDPDTTVELIVRYEATRPGGSDCLEHGPG